MATFHLSTRTSRIAKKGKTINAANHYAYITRQGKYTAIEDLTYMETGRLPNCDELKSQKDFWTAADEYKRKNGRTYREVDIALQEEFTKEENIELIHQFLDHFGIREKQVYAFAIHDKQASYDVHHRNVHCHIMFNERILSDRKFEQAKEVFKQWAGPIKQNERGGLQVDRYFSKKQFVTDMRNYWEKINNEKFKELGLETRMSSKTLKEQRKDLIDEGKYEEAEALNREPAKHMGPAFKYPDTQKEVMAMADKMKNERDEDQRLAKEQVIATLKRRGIPYEGMEYDTSKNKSNYGEDEEEQNIDNSQNEPNIDFVELLIEEKIYQAEQEEVEQYNNNLDNKSNSSTYDYIHQYYKAYKDEYEKTADEMIEEIDKGKISKETFDKLVSLQSQKLHAQREKQQEEEKKQNQSNEDLSQKIFELKKELMARDIVFRHATRLAQLDKADMDKKRYRKIMFRLKEYGFDESIATNGVIITVNDICKEIGELRYKELNKVSRLKAKIEKRNERVQVNVENKVIAMDRFTDGAYSKSMAELNKLNEKIAELRKVTQASIKNLQDYFAKCEEEKQITEKRNQVQKNIDKYTAKANGQHKDLYYTYLKNVAKEKKIAEKYNDGDMVALKKHQQLADLLEERRTTLKKEFPKETILYGENIPSKVYLTYKINGQEIKRMPFVPTRNGIFFIINKPKEPQYGKQIQLQCVKLGEEAPLGKAKVYTATVLVEQKTIGAKGIIIPQYIPVSVAPTDKTALLYNIDNPETRLKLNPQNANGKGKSIKVITSNKAPRISMGSQDGGSQGANALAQLLQNSVSGTATIRDKIQSDEKSADRKSAEAAKRDDVTKDMALENEQLENGEWVQQMRQNYGRRC